jgi:8-oxo-dGTP pyrophosphatase MutT (NUDIX family)
LSDLKKIVIIDPVKVKQLMALANLKQDEVSGGQPAGVLMPLLRCNGETCLLFTRRSEKVLNHKGQVAFPGGAAEPFDESIVATALREAQEEIALPPNQVEILGIMPALVSTSRFHVTPVVGWIHGEFEIMPNPDEVARVFVIPVKWLRDPANVEYRTLETPWERHENVVFYQPYDDEVVWGFTGALTVQFLKLIQVFGG